MGNNAIDHTGDRFGRLLILEKSHKGKGRYWWWRCLCDCGKELAVCGRQLRNGDTKSCGCLAAEIFSELSQKNTIHGMASTKKGKPGIYQSWADAKSRCSNPNVKAYYRYGGKGIKVCIRWQSFEAFLEDMGSEWQPGLTLDRIDPDGDYEPRNCQWLTRGENASKGNKHP